MTRRGPVWLDSLLTPRWLPKVADLAGALIVGWGLVALVHWEIAGLARAMFGLPGMLFLPGFVLLEALHPHRADWDVLERLGLSVALSIVLITVAGLVAVVSPWGLRAASVALSLAMVSTGLAGVAVYHRLHRQSDSGPGVLAHGAWAVRLRKTLRERRLHLTAALCLVAFVVLLGGVIYRFQKLSPGASFTEFYVLSASGETGNYLTALTVGMPAAYRVGIKNRERRQAAFRVRVVLQGRVISEEGPITLKYEELWERQVTVIPPQPVELAKLEFFLHREGDPDPYQRAYLWVRVDTE